MNFEQLPAFIPASAAGGPLNFIWRGHMAHIGPVEQSTPLLKKLGNTTMLTEVALCTGVSLWGAWRLREAIDTSHFLELAQAAFAYCIDWRYLDTAGGPQGKAPEFPPEVSASKYLNYLMRRALNHENYWNSTFVPASETFHSIHLVRHMLGVEERYAFDHWLDELVNRIRLHAPRPALEYRELSAFRDKAAYNAYYAPVRGVPVPPQFIDTTFNYREADRTHLLQQFLTKLDHKANRYLRSPEQMMELGFEGKPYQL